MEEEESDWGLDGLVSCDLAALSMAATSAWHFPPASGASSWGPPWRCGAGSNSDTVGGVATSSMSLSFLQPRREGFNFNFEDFGPKSRDELE